MTSHTYFEKIGLLPHGTRSAWIGYVSGFFASLLITLAAYAIVTHHLLLQRDTLVLIVLLAIMQFFVQAFAFLHLGWGITSRDRSIIFIFVSIIVAILVGGSVWIMTSLNQRMMPDAAQMEQFMNSQPGL